MVKKKKKNPFIWETLSLDMFFGIVSSENSLIGVGGITGWQISDSQKKMGAGGIFHNSICKHPSYSFIFCQFFPKFRMP